MFVPRHEPVMAERCLELLAPALQQPHAVVIDGTLGLGGHSELLLSRFPQLRIIGIDRDTHALAIAQQRLQQFGDRLIPFHGLSSEMSQACRTAGVSHVDGVLLDLGVSSMQLDDADRGFAYSYDTVLDMRMDTTRGITAAEVCNTYSVDQLAGVLKKFGDERYAYPIAKSIARSRQTQPLTSTGQLVALIDAAIPKKAKLTGGHPAKRAFQALRIEVNSELQILVETMPVAAAMLRVGGRMVVMSYQSGEDRIVKKFLTAASQPSVPVDMPVIPEDSRPWLQLLTRGAQVASDSEIAANPRAASVRLRAMEKLREPALSRGR